MNWTLLKQVYFVNALDAVRQTRLIGFMPGTFGRQYFKEGRLTQETLEINLISQAAGMYEVTSTKTFEQVELLQTKEVKKTKTWKATYDNSKKLLMAHKGYRFWIFLPERHLVIEGNKEYLKSYQS